MQYEGPSHRLTKKATVLLGLLISLTKNEVVFQLRPYRPKSSHADMPCFSTPTVPRIFMPRLKKHGPAAAKRMNAVPKSLRQYIPLGANPAASIHTSQASLNDDLQAFFLLRLLLLALHRFFRCTGVVRPDGESSTRLVDLTFFFSPSRYTNKIAAKAAIHF
ncbi:hypothetical protein K504DRAFT_170987 [Pleomassaria siparia CBS 279.74]|uniref:Uncharacterized protein n=1 Tax=Pleomassaria siparia CBS 279.74 TaxID=1314801 RepID=A0A6G1JT26_9PLEO|nr:hypothetical protein K504DRAFT_170987 [Pleomassaria siparia CBS 279.74]